MVTFLAHTVIERKVTGQNEWKSLITKRLGEG